MYDNLQARSSEYDDIHYHPLQVVELQTTHGWSTTRLLPNANRSKVRSISALRDGVLRYCDCTRGQVLCNTQSPDCMPVCHLHATTRSVLYACMPPVFPVFSPTCMPFFPCLYANYILLYATCMPPVSKRVSIMLHVVRNRVCRLLAGWFS